MLLGTWRICQSFLIYFLLVLALIQGAILAFSYFNRELPVPRFLFNKIEEGLASIGVYPQSGEFFVDLTGKVFVRDLKIATIDSDDLLVSSEAALIGLQLPYLIIGDLEIKSIRLSHTSLYLPAIYSASGVNEPVIERLNCNLMLKNPRWHLEQLNFFLHNLRVEAKGIWKPPPKTLVTIDPAQKQPALPETILERYYLFCSKIMTLHPTFSKLKAPILEAVLQPDARGMPRADITLAAQGGTFFNTIRVGSFQMKMNDVGYFQLDPKGPVKFNLDTFTWINKIEAENLEALFEINSLHPDQIKIPRLVSLAAHRLWRDELVADNLVAEIVPHLYPIVRGNAFIKLDGRPLAFKGEADVNNRTAELHINSRVELEKIPVLSILLDSDMSKNLSFSGPPHVIMDVSLSDAYKLDHLDYSLDTTLPSLNGVTIDRFAARGSLTPLTLVADNIIMEKNSNRLTGSYQHNLKNNDFRMLAKGNFLPSHLNKAMRPWWTALWNNFIFSDGFTYNDIDFRGNWNDRSRRLFYGELKADNLSYKGLSLLKGRTTVWAFPGYVRLIDLMCERVEGRTMGSLNSFFALDAMNTRTHYFDFRTEFAIPELSPLLGSDVSSIMDNFTFTAAPRVNLIGMRHIQGENEQLKRDVKIKAETDQAHTIYGYPIDSISFQGHLTDDFFDIDYMKFGVSDGYGSGNMHFRKTQDGPRVDFDLILKEADYARVLSAIGFEDKYLNSSGNGSKNQLTSFAPGQLDLYLNAIGVPGELTSFEGEGRFSITKAELGKFHLAGMLSRFFGSSLLGFTPLALDSMGGDIILDHNLINFPKITFTGPYSIVRADGNVTLPNKDLEFRVLVSYLENKNNPVVNIFGIPLFPFGQVLQLRLRGSLAEPQWRFALDPRNVFETPAIDVPQVEEK